MTTVVAMGDVVWTPRPDALETTRIGDFISWLHEHRGITVTDHESLWQWSVSDLDGFWSAIWDFFDVADHGARTSVLAERVMPGAVWFPGSLLNYAEQALRGAGADDDTVAVHARSQARPDVDLTWGDLRDQVARARRVLADLGVGQGDRVAGYLPNTPEAVIAFLAAAGLGAVWTSCAIEFGARSVIDRFEQVEPVVLLVAGGYRYGAKDIDRRAEIDEVRAALPSVRHVLDIEMGDWRVRRLPVLAGRARHRSPNPAPTSYRCRSTTRWSCCSRPAPLAAPRRSSTVTAGSLWSI